MPWSSGGGNEWGLHRNWVSQERISAELRCPTIESEMRNVKVAIVKYGTIATSGLEFGPGSGSSVIDVGGGEILVGGTKLLAHLIGEALAALELMVGSNIRPSSERKDKQAGDPDTVPRKHQRPGSDLSWFFHCTPTAQKLLNGRKLSEDRCSHPNLNN